MVSKVKKVSLDTIMQKKGLIDEVKPFYSDFFGGEIDIVVGIGEKIIKIMNGKAEEMYKYYELIYTACPVFRSKELVKEYELDDPILVVKQIYNTNIGELVALGNHILSAYGLLNEKFLTIKKL